MSMKIISERFLSREVNCEIITSNRGYLGFILEPKSRASDIRRGVRTSPCEPPMRTAKIDISVLSLKNVPDPSTH
jgi:hypothetical protein